MFQRRNLFFLSLRKLPGQIGAGCDGTTQQSTMLVTTNAPERDGVDHFGLACINSSPKPAQPQDQGGFLTRMYRRSQKECLLAGSRAGVAASKCDGVQI